MYFSFFTGVIYRSAILSVLIVIISVLAAAQPGANVNKGKDVYDQIRSFSLTGGSADVSGLVLKRDRVTMTFTGTFYFTAPVEGRITGAVFRGTGNMRAEPPPSDFEKANLKRILDADVVESTFDTAVLRFSDDTFDLIGANKKEAATAADIQKIANDTENRIARETGANLSSRLTLSILNGEKPGVFFAHFEGGKRGHFSYIFDPQTRIPTANFSINAGEKGLIFWHDSLFFRNEVWLAFYSLGDYSSGAVSYSDSNDLVDVTHYKINADLLTPKNKFALSAAATMTTKVGGLRAISFDVGEDLGDFNDARSEKQLKLKTVRMGSTELSAVQEKWDGSILVFLPAVTGAGQKLEIEFNLVGDFLLQPTSLDGDCFYPISTASWYPRHGYLDRATFDFTYLHSKKHVIASSGTRQSEQPDPADPDHTITRYAMRQPVPLATFAMGPFKRHQDVIKWDKEQTTTPLEFNSLTGQYIQLREDFVLAELNNSVRYFHNIFGAYPYDSYAATYHPYGYGQGFASMLLIPRTDTAGKYTYSFISHETAHQWWGNIVAWRSYRDQWLSEGFAEYSGVLYSALRQDPGAAKTLVDDMRRNLKLPARKGFDGRVNEIGPLILGHRLNSEKAPGAYSNLIYNKGGLVLRMLHFLFSDPATGDDKAFFEMMRAFVEKYRNSSASTDDFRAIANENFVKTPIAQKYKMTDLNWFFRQWVYRTELPSYQLNYSIQKQPDGTAVVSGTIVQEDVPANWFMPMPVTFTMSGGKFVHTTIGALGPSTPFTIKLPTTPSKVELDPIRWVLSDKTSTN